MRLYVVTGTSRGLGLGIARRVLAEDVVLHAVSRRRSRELEAAAASAGAILVEHQLDLAEVARIPELLREIVGSTTTDGLQEAVLINNAGVLEPVGPAVELEPEAITRHLSVNLAAVMQLTGSFLAETRSATFRRTVVNVSSGAAQKPYRGWGPYCASKAGLEMFTRVTALEEAAEENVRVLAVAPGVVDTDMQALLRSTDETRFPAKSRFVDLKESGKLAEPERAAELILRAVADAGLESGSCIDVRDYYAAQF
ncbi:MAG: SDR family NAD(P)-dependent oxidoreductase [Spirochaetaceae bacterium]